MKQWRLWVVIGSVMIARAVAAQAPMIRTHPPKVHASVCSLAESLADKFPSKKMTRAEAEKICQQLSPTMSAENHTEFMRCCSARLLQR